MKIIYLCFRKKFQKILSWSHESYSSNFFVFSLDIFIPFFFCLPSFDFCFLHCLHISFWKIVMMPLHSRWKRLIVTSSDLLPTSSNWTSALRGKFTSFLLQMKLSRASAPQACVSPSSTPPMDTTRLRRKRKVGSSPPFLWLLGGKYHYMHAPMGVIASSDEFW